MATPSELELLPVEVTRVMPFRDTAAVVLKHGPKHFMIFVGLGEAAAIRRELAGERTERPLTHDVITYVLQGFDIKVSKVVISSIVKDIFCATLVLEREGHEGTAKSEVRLDVRASDSMVIALKTRSQIWVTRRVLDTVEDATETLEGFDRQIAAAQSDEAADEDEGLLDVDPLGPLDPSDTGPASED